MINSTTVTKNSQICCQYLPKRTYFQYVKQINRNKYIPRCQFYTRKQELYKIDYHKRDDFSFRIVNFPFSDEDVPLAPSCSVYIHLCIPTCLHYNNCTCVCTWTCTHVAEIVREMTKQRVDHYWLYLGWEWFFLSSTM